MLIDESVVTLAREWGVSHCRVQQIERCALTKARLGFELYELVPRRRAERILAQLEGQPLAMWKARVSAVKRERFRVVK